MAMFLGPLLAAPFVGSFLGVLVRRLPAGEPWMLSRSRCNACGALLRARDLVPLASFAAVRGRCRQCGQAISWFYPAIELAAAGVALSAVLSASGPAVWLWCVLGWGLLALAWIDWETLLLPDALTLPLLMAGLLAGFGDEPNSAAVRAAGAIAGWCAFAVTGRVYRYLRKRDGLGGGDAKLLAVAGAWLGPDMLPWVVTLGALTATIWAVGTRGWHRHAPMEEPIAFGPWLALSIWVVALTECDTGPIW